MGDIYNNDSMNGIPGRPIAHPMGNPGMNQARPAMSGPVMEPVMNGEGQSPMAKMSEFGASHQEYRADARPANPQAEALPPPPNLHIDHSFSGGGQGQQGGQQGGGEGMPERAKPAEPGPAEGGAIEGGAAEAGGEAAAGGAEAGAEAGGEGLMGIVGAIL